MAHKKRKNTGQKTGYKIMRTKMTSRATGRRGNTSEDADERFIDFSRTRNISPEFYS